MARKLAQFPHRRDSKGLYDSICPTCFATVARSKPEAEMAQLELAHVCNSSYLAERGQFGRAETQNQAAPLRRHTDALPESTLCTETL